MYSVSNIKENKTILPREPGVYIYYNADKKVIYVGKAKSLRNRVSSYFTNKTALGEKTFALVSEIAYIRFVVVRNELEAFLLEANLIKKYLPHYNSMLKDGKSYKHIYIQNLKETIDGKPTIVALVGSTHEKKFKDSEYYGPYPQGNIVNNVLRLIRRVFPYRNCSPAKFKRYQRAKRPCIYGEIGLCPGPCVAKKAVSENRKNVARIRKILKGGYSSYVAELEKKRKRYSDNQEYELAKKVNDHIKELESFSYTRVTPYEYEDNPNLIEDIRAARVKGIAKAFGIELADIEKAQFRVECYDISNIMGQWATGSMVVSLNGKLEKNDYRKFKIRYTRGISDFHMMKEVLKRRLNHPEWGVPGLILADGGKGQVGKVREAIRELLERPVKSPEKKAYLAQWETVKVVGIFKPHDYFVQEVDTGPLKWKITRPDRREEWYSHLRNLRDEAHRFAKSYHKKLRTNIVNGTNE